MLPCHRHPSLPAALAFMMLATGASAQELGRGGSMASGGAGPNGSVNANAQLERCDAPKGTLAVVTADGRSAGA